MLLFFLVTVLGVEPVDLNRIDLKWRDVGISDLLTISKYLYEKHKFDIQTIASYYAISKIEQPSKKKGFELRVPNNNSVGWHPWGRVYPWKWSKSFFVYLPNGYFRIVDKKGLCFYFSFEYLLHCATDMCMVIKIRGIYNGRSYARKWAGSSETFSIFKKYKEYWVKFFLSEVVKEIFKDPLDPLFR